MRFPLPLRSAYRGHDFSQVDAAVPNTYTQSDAVLPNGGSNALNNDIIGGLLQSEAEVFASTALATQPTFTVGQAIGAASSLAEDPYSVTPTTVDSFLSSDIPTATTEISSAATDAETATTAETAAAFTSTTDSAPVTGMPTVVAASQTSASSADSSTTASSSHKSGVSSGAIGVIVTLLILAGAALAFFVMRRRSIQKRAKRRSTWSPAVEYPPTFDQGARMDFEDLEASETSPDSPEKRQEHFDTIDLNEKHGATPLPDDAVSNNAARVQSALIAMPNVVMPASPPPLHPTGFAPPRMPSPPPISIIPANEPGPLPVGIDAPSPVDHSAPLIASTFTAVTSLRPQSNSVTPSSSSALVVVVRTFVPTLPDELSLQTGEQVRVLERYDDGWAHVERLRSGAGVESGVVPLECLEEGSVGMGLAQGTVESWRLSKRKSSLSPTGTAKY